MSCLLIPDLARLQAKLAGGTPPLDRWWPHFLALARHQAEVFPLFPAFAYAGTGERAYAELARERILAQVRCLPAYEYSIHVQFHTWCNTQPLARLAIAYDWVADSGVFSAAEQAEIAERYVDYAYKHPYLVAQSRKPAADNQIMAMCFGCAVIGYLFGVKRGNDPRAREVFAYGVNRFPEFAGYSEPGGYSLEGSTYMDQVVMPSVALWAAFMEEITGEDHLHRRYPPNATCLREALEMDALLIGPSGLQPPWDHYGFQRAVNKCGIAYLAQKTGNHGWLALLQALDLWAESDHIAWGTDDKLWTLLWWPDDAHIPAAADAFPSWVVGNTAAALDAPARQLRLFQFWDRTGANFEVGRTQVNPNAIILEAFGSPFLVDGTPTKACTHFNYPLAQAAPYMVGERMARTLQLYKEIGSAQTEESWLRGWTYGCVGGSNSIVVDDEPWYAPAESKQGRAVAFAATPPLKAVTSEAATCYQPHVDVTTMRRTSVLVHDRYVLVRDRIAAASPHRWTWQVYTRPGAQALETGFRIETSEQARCDLVPAQAYARTHQHVPGYPHALEQAADLLQYHQTGAEATFAVGLFPANKLALLDDLTAGWRAGVAAEEAAVLLMPAAGVELSLAELPYFRPEAPVTAWRWLQRTVSRPPEGRVFLRVEKAVAAARVWVNGREIPQPDTCSAHEAGDRLVPLVVELTDALAEGDNLLVLAAPPTLGKTFAGAAGLYRGIEPPAPPAVTELAPGCFAIGDDLLLVDTDGDTTVAGWETDAWCALLDPAEGAALGASYCRGDGVLLHGDRGDTAWSGQTLDAGHLGDTAERWCQWAGGAVHLEAGGVIRLSGTPGITVRWRSASARPVFVNGVPVPPAYDPVGRVYHVTLVAAEVPAAAHRWARAVALAWQPGEAARLELEALLQDAWWTVRGAAALSLGTRREAAAVPALIAALQAELAKENYPPMAQQRDAADLPHPPADFLDPAAQEQFVKRWRVIMCVAIALGQLGDARAVPALCAILDRKVDFYPALANAALALGRIGDPAALPTLDAYADYFEINARHRAREAAQRIRDREVVTPGI